MAPGLDPRKAGDRARTDRRDCRGLFAIEVAVAEMVPETIEHPCGQKRDPHQLERR